MGISTQKSTDGKTGNGGKSSHQTMASKKNKNAQREAAYHMKNYRPGYRPRPDQHNAGSAGGSALKSYLATQKAQTLAALRGTQPPPPVATMPATSATLPSYNHWATTPSVHGSGRYTNSRAGNRSGKGYGPKHGKNAPPFSPFTPHTPFSPRKKASATLGANQVTKPRAMRPPPANQNPWSASRHKAYQNQEAQIQAALREKENELAALRASLANHANYANQAIQANQAAQAQAYQAAMAANYAQRRAKRIHLLGELLQTGSTEEVFLDTMEAFRQRVNHCLGGFSLGTDGGDVHMCDCNGNYSLCLLQLYVDLAETRRR